MELKSCPVCKEIPVTFQVNLAGDGGLTHKTWVTECAGSELDGESFIAHTLSAYGNSSDHAQGRWNKI